MDLREVVDSTYADQSPRRGNVVVAALEGREERKCCAHAVAGEHVV